MWRRFLDLVILLSQAEGLIHITLSQWLQEARPFGELYSRCFRKEEVTPYIHIFVYHVGFYLEHWGSIQKFANYSLEGTVSVDKRILQQGTSHFGGQNASRQGLAKQQLQYAH